MLWGWLFSSIAFLKKMFRFETTEATEIKEKTAIALSSLCPLWLKKYLQSVR